MTHNEWVERYQITDNAGMYRNRGEVLKTVVSLLCKRGVPKPTRVAVSYLDNDVWLRRRAGETAGSIARAVSEEHEVIMLWNSRVTVPDPA